MQFELVNQVFFFRLYENLQEEKRRKKKLNHKSAHIPTD